MTESQNRLHKAKDEMTKKTKVFEKEEQTLQKSYDQYKAQEEQKELETKALLS